MNALHHGLADFLRRCRSSGISTSLDPNFDTAGTWDCGIESVLRHVGVLFCNEHEAHQNRWRCAGRHQ